MPHYKLTESWTWDIPSSIKKYISDTVEEQFPDLKIFLPGDGAFSFEGCYDSEVLILKYRENGPGFVNAFGSMKGEEFNFIKTAADKNRNFRDLYNVDILKKYFSDRSFILVLSFPDRFYSSEELCNQIIDWLNEMPLKRALKDNSDRVARAIPIPPVYDLKVLHNACWVVESDLSIGSGIAQGSAFYLDGYGFVTCEHVLHDRMNNSEPYRGMRIFHPNNVSRKYEIRIKKKNAHLDLCLFEADIPEDVIEKLHPYTDNDVPLNAHVAVCGYPNYKLGDTCLMSPGLVVAYRMYPGAVRRLQTNAGIVVGMSGGPAIGINNEVIGVLATGAIKLTEKDKTEDQSIIPISALNILI